MKTITKTYTGEYIFLPEGTKIWKSEGVWKYQTKHGISTIPPRVFKELERLNYIS